MNSKEEISRMFVDNKGIISNDEELALHIIHKFNIDSDTIEDMPAFEEHLKIFFLNKKD